MCIRDRWSSDGRYLVSASKDSTAKLWEIPSGKKAKETLPGHEDEVYALDWSPNGASVATGSKDRKVCVSIVLSYELCVQYEVSAIA